MTGESVVPGREAELAAAMLAVSGLSPDDSERAGLIAGYDFARGLAAELHQMAEARDAAPDSLPHGC